MARRKLQIKREVVADPKFGSVMVTKFINKLMWQGKRTTAARAFYDALDMIAKKTGEDPLKIFSKAVDNVKPVVETRSRRVGGATYQVPMEVRHERQTSLAIRWLVEYARERAGKGITDQLAGELLDAASEKGGAFKKREDVHKMAESNRAFAHYRW